MVKILIELKSANSENNVKQHNYKIAESDLPKLSTNLVVFVSHFESFVKSDSAMTITIQRYGKFNEKYYLTESREILAHVRNSVYQALLSASA